MFFVSVPYKSMMPATIISLAFAALGAVSAIQHAASTI